MSAYDSQIPYKPVDEPVRKSRSNQNFDKLTVGSGSKRFEVNVKDGLWMGANTFAEGNFSVDFEGNIIASSILIKNSNGDTLIDSNAVSDYVNVINSKLNTNTQKLLKDFTFDGYTGAFKTGDIAWDTGTGAITSGSGGLFFSDGLVFAKNGTPTIVLDGATGDATFSGTVAGINGTFGIITAGVIKVNGVWLGEISGHSGLSLNGNTDYNNIFFKRDSDGIVFFRVNSGGNSSMTYDSSSGVLDIKAKVQMGVGSTLSADYVTVGTLVGRTVKASGGTGVDIWLDSSQGKLQFMYNGGEKSFMASNSDGDVIWQSDNTMFLEFNSDGGAGENFYVFEDGNVAFRIDGSKDGKFYGDLEIAGTLSKGGGTFKIDHPLKPKTHLLFHSFVESPDMLNIYKGRGKTKNKKAIIKLPEYFEALNKDFEYQLTPIKSLAKLGIKSEVKDNKFIVMSDEDCEFSWQVMGVRKDRFALANPVIPEVKKEFEGYLHNELWENEIDEEKSKDDTLEKIRLKGRSDIVSRRKELQKKIEKDKKKEERLQNLINKHKN